MAALLIGWIKGNMPNSVWGVAVSQGAVTGSDRRLEYLLTALFLCVAALLRVHGMTDSDMWADELFSWRQAHSELGDLIDQVGGDIHPPFYFILLKWYVAAFGDSLFALRLFSVIPSVLTVGLLFRFAWQRTDRTIAILATAILLLSPASIYYAHQVRAYALCEMSAVLVVVALFSYLDSRRPAALLLFLLCCVLLNYLHFIGPFFLAGVFALVLCLRLTGRIGDRPFWSVLIMLAISGAALVPWVWFLLGRSHMVAAQSHVYVGLAGVIEAAKVFVKLLGGMFPAIPALLVWGAGLWWSLRPARPDSESAYGPIIWLSHLLVLVPFASFALVGIVGGPFIRLHPAVVLLPWLALLLACCLAVLSVWWRGALGIVYGATLIYAGLTTPYRGNQVPFSKVLDYAVAQKLDGLIVYSQELAETQDFLGRHRMRLIDVRAIPAGLCGGRFGVEVPAKDAAYDSEGRRLAYGLVALGGRKQHYDLPDGMTLLHVENFDYDNTWKPGVVHTYGLYIFEAAPCRAPEAGSIK